ncbi:MAG: hypothetical protein K9L80_01500, partial [Candidatus Omnitrophica bacterium]|nr:hypothetical protein [Candidatus Omnitrophota bacterium]
KTSVLFLGDEGKSIRCLNCKTIIEGSDKVRWVNKKIEIFKCPTCNKSLGVKKNIKAIDKRWFLVDLEPGDFVTCYACGDSIYWGDDTSWQDSLRSLRNIKEGKTIHFPCCGGSKLSLKRKNNSLLLDNVYSEDENSVYLEEKPITKLLFKISFKITTRIPLDVKDTIEYIKNCLKIRGFSYQEVFSSLTGPTRYQIKKITFRTTLDWLNTDSPKEAIPKRYFRIALESCFRIDNSKSYDLGSLTRSYHEAIREDLLWGLEQSFYKVYDMSIKSFSIVDSFISGFQTKSEYSGTI